jgi:hypothetical protein
MQQDPGVINLPRSVTPDGVPQAIYIASSFVGNVSSGGLSLFWFNSDFWIVYVLDKKYWDDGYADGPYPLRVCHAA